MPIPRERKSEVRQNDAPYERSLPRPRLRPSLVAQTHDVVSALKVIEETEPHVVVLDIQMPGWHRSDSIAIMKSQAGPAVAICSCHHDDEIVQAAIAAGAPVMSQRDI